MRFGDKANSYLENACIQKAVAKWCSEWISPFDGQGQALELGAGPGLFTDYLLEAGYENLIATDLSERMVAVGQERLPQLDWRIVDAWKPSIVGIDSLFSCSLLQWAESPLAVLKNWRNCMKPGGKLLACFFIEGSMKELLEAEPAIHALDWHSESEWKQWFTEAGFTLVRSETREDCNYYPTAIEALRSVHSIGAVREGSLGPAKLRSALRKVDAFCRLRVPISWKSLRIEATMLR